MRELFLYAYRRGTIRSGIKTFSGLKISVKKIQLKSYSLYVDPLQILLSSVLYRKCAVPS